MSQPNQKEKELINEIKAAVETHLVLEKEGDSTFIYFPKGCEKTFQDLAVKTANLIGEQGPFQTCLPLMQAARAVKQAGFEGWTQANTLGQAFKKAVHGKYVPKTAQKPANPFIGKRL